MREIPPMPTRAPLLPIALVLAGCPKAVLPATCDTAVIAAA